MIDNFVIISKHEISPLRKGEWTPSALFEAQDYFALRVDKTNEDYLQEFIKFSIDEIKTIKESGIIGKTKIDSTVISCPSPFAMKSLTTGEKLFKRVHGMGSITLNPGEVGDLEFEVPYPWCKLEGIEIMDQTSTSQAELFIEDSDTGTYTGYPRYQLNQFGYSVEIPKGHFEKKSSYDSDLYANMWVVLQMTNTSNEVQTFRANIELDEVRSE
jgi:hypothetical protein